MIVTSLSDAQLRSHLQRFMTEVPPVTDKIDNLERPEGDQPEIEADLSPALNTSQTSIDGVSKSKLAPSYNTLSNQLEASYSPFKKDSFEDNDLSLRGNVEYDSEGYRIRRIPATKLPTYPGGVPIFRRQSLLHSVDPYGEFVIRSPALQAKYDASVIFDRVFSRSGLDFLRH
ncbi:unnamed protein product [Protopolystoma xenopodis]|uniref:Uncharacterized protein n=1 Tax=Protopolystoma xenopodis TaxID=117903 RepID=A0A3S5CCI4_9PLAT|nr:unnamed protein product [Protopolystoma xenopodis]